MILGFGVGAFGWGLGFSPPVFTDEPPVTLVSSQQVDLVTGKLGYDDDGNEVGMDDTAQRIVLLARTAKLPSLRGVDFTAAVEDALRKALVPVTGGTPPDATITSVTVVPTANGVQTTITYTNNLTNTETSITL